MITKSESMQCYCQVKLEDKKRNKEKISNSNGFFTPSFCNTKTSCLYISKESNN